MAGRFDPLNRTAVRGGRTDVPPGRASSAGGGAGERRWVPDGPVDLGLTLGPLRRGPGDPTFRTTPDGSVWRATRTPEGPATLRVSRTGPAGTEIDAEAWGAGAAWLLDQLPALLGAGDDPAVFVPRHRLVHASHRSRPGLRLTRTGLVLESLIPTVLEQKVTADEAYRAWRRLVRQYGEPAPGPHWQNLYVMPDPRTWALIPSWDWHKAGVDAKRSDTIVRAVRVANRLEEAAAMDLPEAARRLEAVPGIGPWTSAETLQRSNGHPDAVTTGDLHLPGIIGYALAGDRDADDAAMLELLAPYAGQRHRAARLILLAGRTPPRRSPRMYRSDIGRF
ncbi:MULTISPECIES: DNA-3-methyladenine glycosylase family protein [unclassified Streptomyces]|uniref:DNA-3-methyladenine glycosylase family protein n=1 Tax=unclassified Streptomyces TaxID=2593676 RepID=UPI0006ADD4C1|nr:MULTISPECIES: DNA-3-methyladenine glycosylase [unclassified Streptomyces]KOU82927.1 3-methyladenine DNA glycosylase [Streptomyces sp. XY58]KOV04406.1 3-methyladenine DNA glycosylase [Streptomyces sp. XY37]KOV44772.1 3-methyladenine DNA glycosylase [Streptomyces sp. MMG1064]